MSGCPFFLSLVIYNERYSDLEKSIYLPSPPEEQVGEKERVNALQSTEDFMSLHPCGQLDTKQAS